MLTLKTLPGTLWESHGAWHWRVKLPGSVKRSDYTLTMPSGNARIPSGEATRKLAEGAAWRLWEDAARRAKGGGPAPTFTVNDLCDRWAAFAEGYYRDSSEGRDSVRALRTFRSMFGTRAVECVTHPDMIEFRKALVDKGYVRTTVNKYLNTVKRVVAWALDERLVSAGCKAELTAISPLKRRRSAARECEPVTAVSDGAVEATLERLTPSVADMVRVHRLTGMRPGEVCQLHWADIEERGGVWVFRPRRHKGVWRGTPRVVVIGPRAQAILGRYRGDGYVFSPALAVREQYDALIAGATCHRSAGRVKGAPRKVGEAWNPGAYAKAVNRAAEEAGVPRWHPNQLRHTCATEIRRRFGINAAGAVLGHTLGLRITDRYSFEAAEDEIVAAAAPAMLEMG